MTRVFLTIVLPLLLPMALYIVWALATNRIRPAGSAASWLHLPWAWLLLAGVALAAAVLFYYVQFGVHGQGQYVPPHLQNGRIVPGHVVPEPQGHD